MIAASMIIWSTALSLHLTFLFILELNLFLLFIVAVPVQVLEILWYLFRRKKNKTGNYELVK